MVLQKQDMGIWWQIGAWFSARRLEISGVFTLIDPPFRENTGELGGGFFGIVGVVAA